MATVDICRFQAASSGTGDFVVSSAVTGYQTPASAGAVNGTVYSYRAESVDLTQWEIGYGAYTSGTTTLARTTVIASSTGSKVSFSAAPQVALVTLTRDFIGGSTGSTDNAVLRADGTSGLTSQGSALLVADTTGALSRIGAGGIPVQGSNTNDSAAAGDIGEYVSSSVMSGSAVSPATTVTSNITSISLTAGDWDVRAVVYFKIGAGTTFTIINTSVSQTSATMDFTSGAFFRVTQASTAGAAGAIDPATSIAIPPYRVSLSSTTTVYLVANATYTGGTMGLYGLVSARRVR